MGREEAKDVEEFEVEDWATDALSVAIQNDLKDAWDWLEETSEAEGSSERDAAQLVANRSAGSPWKQQFSVRDSRSISGLGGHGVDAPWARTARTGGELDFGTGANAGGGGGEEGVLGTQGISAQLIDATKRHLSFRGNKKGRLRRVTEEDYPAGPAREVMKVILAGCRAVYLSRSTPAERAKAFAWVYREDDGFAARHPLTLRLCCQVLGVRPFIVRTRLMYELARRWIVFVEAPAGVVDLPVMLADEMGFRYGEPGVKMAEHAWRQPGIRTAELLQSMNGGSARAARVLEECEEEGYMINREGHWYTSGRNPEVRGQRGGMLMAPSHLIRTRETPWPLLWPDD